MTDDRPPRRPGPARARDVFVTFQVRFGLTLLCTAFALAVLKLADPDGTTLSGRAAEVLFFMLGVLGAAALVHAARVAARRRRR